MDRANADVDQAVEALEGALPARALGVVLGSGLGGFAESLEPRVSVAFEQVPGFPRCHVPGHAGILHAGCIAERDVIVFEGRSHLYEGGPREYVTFPPRLLGRIGASALILTTAAGAVNASYQPGDLVLIRDHVNLTGWDPLLEVPLEQRNPMFPAGAYYHPELLDRLCGLAFGLGVKFHQGVLAGVSGPSYETAAEVRALRAMQADIVSMSTVVEAMAAAAVGVPVVAVAVVTNRAGEASNDHEEVLKVAGAAAERLGKLLVTAVEELNWVV